MGTLRTSTPRTLAASAGQATSWPSTLKVPSAMLAALALGHTHLTARLRRWTLRLAMVVLAGVSVALVRPAPALADSGGWTLTVYYLAVQDFYSGPTQAVSGCLSMDCRISGDLGTYETTFLAAARWQGAGKITRGLQAGLYLNWDPENGYWLDTTFRDASGHAVVPWVTAAHASLPFGTTFRVTDCGVDSSSNWFPEAICAALSGPTWVVSDRFGTDNPDGKPNALDLYIGEQTDADMEGNPYYIMALNAVTTLAAPSGKTGAAVSGTPARPAPRAAPAP